MKPENFYDEENLYHKNNRDQSSAPESRTLHWCDHCDRDMVHLGEKYPTCGKRAGKKRRKK